MARRRGSWPWPPGAARIDTLISDKKALSAQILDPGAGAEAALTEMSNDELLRFVALDLKSASED